MLNIALRDLTECLLAEVYACVPESSSINSGDQAEIPTGIALSIPEGYILDTWAVDQIPGLGTKGTLFGNSTATDADEDFKQLILLMTNTSNEPIVINRDAFLTKMAFSLSLCE